MGGCYSHHGRHSVLRSLTLPNMAPSFHQEGFIRGAVCRSKLADSNATIRMTMLHDVINWQAYSRNEELLINPYVDSEALNHASNRMLRPRRVYFWIPCRFKAMVSHDILSGDRFEMIRNLVYKHMNNFVPGYLDDYIEETKVILMRLHGLSLRTILSWFSMSTTWIEERYEKQFAVIMMV